jgi:uncharacterized protein
MPVFAGPRQEGRQDGPGIPSARPDDHPGIADAQDALDAAVWQACRGSQRRAAERLLAAGAHIDAQPEYAGCRGVDAVLEPDTRRDTMAAWLRERGATSSS